MENSIAVCKIAGCTRPVKYKRKGLCQTHYIQEYRKGVREPEKKIEIPPEIVERMSTARTTEDWQALGQALTPIMASIMAGTVNASAGQVSLIKDIMNRAYGKPVNTQAEKKVSTGVVLLPALSSNENAMTCPNCQFEALYQLADDMTKQLGLKVLRELLERVIAQQSKTEVVS